MTECACGTGVPRNECPNVYGIDQHFHAWDCQTTTGGTCPPECAQPIKSAPTLHALLVWDGDGGLVRVQAVGTAEVMNARAAVWEHLGGDVTVERVAEAASVT